MDKELKIWLAELKRCGANFDNIKGLASHYRGGSNPTKLAKMSRAAIQYELRGR